MALSGLSIGPSWLACSLDRVLTEPKSDASSIYQRLVILLPVANAVLIFLFGGSCIFSGSHVKPKVFV
jgi:hypothetical protein